MERESMWWKSWSIDWRRITALRTEILSETLTQIARSIRLYQIAYSREFEPIIHGTKQKTRQLYKWGLAIFQARSSLKDTITHILTCFTAGNKGENIKYFKQKYKNCYTKPENLLFYIMQVISFEEVLSHTFFLGASYKITQNFIGHSIWCRWR